MRQSIFEAIVSPADPRTNPAFRAWFGNSKVVDDDGRPLMVFHGTSADITAFIHTHNGAGSRESHLGFWFTENPEAASGFAYFAKRHGGADSNIVPVYLSIQNPWMPESYSEIKALIDKHTVFDRPGYLVGGQQIRMVQDKVDIAGAITELRNHGYDGIILSKTLTDSPDGKTPINQYIILSPNQAKSVMNKGEFNPESDHISEDVWHGSPHAFTQFSPHNANKGSGSHMYGWGLYFASKREVASQYKNTRATAIVDGRSIVVPHWDDLQDIPEEYAAKALWSTSDPIASLQMSPKGFFHDPETAAKALALFQANKVQRGRGNMYRVAIPDDDAFLNWDDPLTDQPYESRSAIEKAGLIPRGEPKLAPSPRGGWGIYLGWNEIAWSRDEEGAEEILAEYQSGEFDPEEFTSGADLYRHLSQKLGSDKAASLYLLKIGIPGLRYKPTEESRDMNYVLFDASLASIKAVEQ